MARTLVGADRAARQELHDRLLADFADLPAGVVLGAVARARRDLARLGRCDGLWEAVELVARQRLVELVGQRVPR